MAAASIGFREPDGKLLVAQVMNNKTLLVCVNDNRLMKKKSTLAFCFSQKCLYASIHKTIGFPPEQVNVDISNEILTEF